MIRGAKCLEELQYLGAATTKMRNLSASKPSANLTTSPLTELQRLNKIQILTVVTQEIDYSTPYFTNPCDVVVGVSTYYSIMLQDLWIESVDPLQQAWS